MAYPDVLVQVDVVHGQAAFALVDRSAEADLLLISRPAHGGFVHFLGATARAVIRDAACPVEVVPPVDETLHRRASRRRRGARFLTGVPANRDLRPCAAPGVAARWKGDTEVRDAGTSGAGRGLMFQTRFHGRGGQGVVTAAELLSLAAFDQGRHGQAIPSFGSERTGAPVIAYCRIDDRPIRAHDPVTAPDAVVVQDPTMLHIPGVLDDVAVDGVVLVNSSRSPSELGLDGLALRVVTVPASDLARRRLGRPLPNTCLLGALAGLTGAVELASSSGRCASASRGRPAS